ncbi:hypothetical protein C6P40_005301 [Pichia californica]|uniref:Xylanolytic transcriptional activator regulatory domain-containing protein n=1 Tax=Pichia californica TaxID=460514 RepID=A0A9P6WPT6_9ASCO|nr:hypothetical protein C6P42_000086 [[Candida] californica]KAG0691074.1 hypothetical protein C6P40_005301 [[Candida] californica]
MYEDENSRISSQLENIANVMKELATINNSFDCRNKENKDDSDDSNNNKTEESIGIESTSMVKKQNENMESNDSESCKSSSLNEKYPTPVSFKEFNDKFLSVYGPTSVFDSITVSKNKNNKELQEIDSLNRNPKILEYVKLFFIWQYPDIHIFIFREAFLLDFFHAKKSSAYCSKELIFSVCAFGSLFSEESEKRLISIEFYEKAKALAFQNYFKPSISLLQTFLLLGLYDIYNGRNDSGWMLSGMAIRIGYSIGLQMNPRECISDKDFDVKGELGTKIRSRIFWGTYLVDHLIGLLLGRPSSLKMNDTTIEETIELPDIDWIHEYSFQGHNDKHNKILRIGDPLRATVGLMDIVENMLKDIFISKDKNFEFYEKLLLVKKYNKEIFEWRRSLIPDLMWNGSDLENIARDPTTLTFKLLYYIVILCLNRPFLTFEVNEVFDDYRQTFHKICSSAINDLTIAIKTTVQVYGFEKSSTLIVYCCVISISVILRTTTDDTGERLKNNSAYKYKLLLFMMTLQKCASIWALSEKAYELIRLKLMHDYNIDIDLELQHFDPSQEINITPGMVPDDIEGMLFGIEENNLQEKLNIVEDNDFVFADIEKMISREDTFGGPPIFMTSDTFNNLESIFSEENIGSLPYEDE